VGDWARPLLENNPTLDEIISINAPWHNKQNCRFQANSPRTFLEGLVYVLISRESKFLRSQKYTHGIDVLGSRQGSWLLRRARIPHRFGVRGYAGGDGWCEGCVDFREDRRVSEAALAFLPLLGVERDVEARPRLFLTDSEKTAAEERWGVRERDILRIVIAPGAGFPEKCWGDDNFTELVLLLLEHTHHRLALIGGQEDDGRVNLSDGSNARIQNLCGVTSLRESAALVSRADFVITNTTVTMHFAGAFRIPSLTLLGPWYESATLHAKQWGYPEGLVLGKESSTGIGQTLCPNDAFQAFIKHFRQNQSTDSHS
jgi:ADP-heptose:LPS heptosyltransferase